MRASNVAAGARFRRFTDGAVPGISSPCMRMTGSGDRVVLAERGRAGQGRYLQVGTCRTTVQRAAGGFRSSTCSGKAAVGLLRGAGDDHPRISLVPSKMVYSLGVPVPLLDRVLLDATPQPVWIACPVAGPPPRWRPAWTSTLAAVERGRRPPSRRRARVEQARRRSGWPGRRSGMRCPGLSMIGAPAAGRRA